MKRARMMNRRLMLEAPQRTPDGAGGFVETWVTLGSLWGAVELRGAGRDLDQASRLQLKVHVRTAPHGALSRPGPEMRFLDGDRVYWIETVHEAFPHDGTLTCFAYEEVGR
jgi:head-tail adaptor